MTDLQFRQGDDRWNALRKRALTDLHWFCTVVLNYPSLWAYRPETHLLPTRFIERRTGIPDLDEAPYQLIEFPRECGKSSIATVAHPIQLACANPDISILIANEKAETAEGFLFSIKRQFENNQLLRALFPEVIPPDLNKTTWSAGRATLQRQSDRKEPTFDTIGVGGSRMGNHYDIINGDDLVGAEAMENARAGSWLVMERVNRWVNQLEPLLSSSAIRPWIRLIGTVWWHDDTYAYIEKAFGKEQEKVPYLLAAKLPDGRTVARQCYRVGNLSVLRIAGYEDGRAVFPEIWSEERMAALRERDPELFSCNIQNDPSNAAVRSFKDEWLKFWQRSQPDEIFYKGDNGHNVFLRPSALPTFVVVDPAFTANKDSDRSAIVTVGSDVEHGKHLVLEAQALKVEPRDLVEEVLNTCVRHRATRLYIEAVAQQAAFIEFVGQRARERNVRVNIESVRPAGIHKDVRIEGLSVYLKSGMLLFEKGQLDLLEEYRRWRPGARRRDVLDALAYASQVWPHTGGAINQSAKERAQRGLDSYLSRRGLATGRP